MLIPCSIIALSQACTMARCSSGQLIWLMVCVPGLGPEMQTQDLRCNDTHVCGENTRLLQPSGSSPVCAKSVTCCCSRMTAAHLQEVHRRRHLLVQPMWLCQMLVLLVH